MNQLMQFIQNHLNLWLSLLFVVIMILVHEYFEQKKRPKSLTPAQAVDLINNENAIIFDLRNNELFQSGHIINAIQAKNNDFETKSMEKYKSKPLILVCERGLTATSLAIKLRTQGFISPIALSGGIQAWQDANLPLIKTKKR